MKRGASVIQCEVRGLWSYVKCVLERQVHDLLPPHPHQQLGNGALSVVVKSVKIS